MAGADRARGGGILTAAPARARDGWLIAAALLALYALLGQGSLYKVDGHSLLWLSKQGATLHAYHTFYLPGLELLKRACAPLGLGLFETARLYSALGTALGVGLAHSAGRVLGLSRLACNTAALLLGASPAVVFYATVVEVHGPFLAFAALAWLCTALCLVRRRAMSAPLVGLACGLAYLAHPTGALLVFLLPAMCAAAGRVFPRAEPFSSAGAALFTGAAGASMGAFILVVPGVLRALLGTEADAGAAWNMLANYPGDELLAPLRTLEIAAEEWLLPFFPASLAALAGLLRARTRLPALLLLAGLVPHFFVAQKMLKGYSELGAYLLPAAFTTALLAADVLRRRAWIVPAVLAAAGLAIVQVRRHDVPERPRSYAQGLRELSGGEPFFLIAGHPYDFEAMLLYYEHLTPHWLGVTIELPPEQLAAALEQLDYVSDECRKLGFPTFVSRYTLESLERAAATDQWLLSHDPEVLLPHRGAAARTILRHLRERYELEPVAAAGFDGYRLR